MENLYKRLKADHLTARKNKNTNLIKILGYILSELDKELISRRTEDEQHKLAMDFILAYEKQNLRAIENFKHDPKISVVFENEVSYLAPYLPKKLTLDEIIELKEKYNLTDLGRTMKYLSANYKGLFDPALVRELFK